MKKPKARSIAFGTIYGHSSHPLRKLGRNDVFRTLSDKGKGRVFNLMFGKKRAWNGDPILGTGRASRLSKPELEREIADILRRHVGVQNFGRV